MQSQNDTQSHLEEFLIDRPIPVAGRYVQGWGRDNNYPTMIRQIVRENGLVSQILNKHFELLWGHGPQLYKMEFTGGRRRKVWIDQDKDISPWLQSWNYLEYLERATVEFLMMNSYFTIIHSNQPPLSRFAVEKLEFLPSDQARFLSNGIDVPFTEVLVGDYFANQFFDFRPVPIFDPEKPREHQKSVIFESLYQSGVKYYARSPLHGSLSWIKVGSQTPVTIDSFSRNSIAPKYHIQAPQLYWEKVRDKLISECQLKGELYSENMLQAAIDRTFEEVSLALSGIEKVGKFLVTELLKDELHDKFVGWTITPIEAKTKDYLAGHLKIAHESSFNVSAGMGMHPALSGLTKAGGLSSGSEFEYAAKIYKQVSTEFAERAIMKNINNAIAINFPGNSTKICFNHDGI